MSRWARGTTHWSAELYEAAIVIAEAKPGDSVIFRDVWGAAGLYDFEESDDNGSTIAVFVAGTDLLRKTLEPARGLG